MADNFLEGHYEDYLLKRDEWAQKKNQGAKDIKRLKKIRAQQQKERIERLRWEK